MKLFLFPMRAAIVAVSLAAALPAHAELTNDGLLGPGVRSRPAYDGSDDQRFEIVPAIRYFGQPLFVRSTQGVLEGGARMDLAPGLHAGVQLAYEPGRDSDESDFLESHGIRDVDRGVSIGAHVEWDHKFGRVPITLLTRVRQHTESDRGAQADVRFSVGIFQRGRVSAGLFTQGTWGNGKALRSLYGLTPPAAAASGLAAYRPGSGLLFASYGLLWSVDLAPNWSVVGSAESRHLGSEAKRSPLVERSSNRYISAAVAYRF